MAYTVVIPARYGSTRLPGKPLLDIHGKPMVQRVWEQACRSGALEVIVATDDQRILDVARRVRCLTSGASRWYGKDALAAEAWLQTSSLDEESRSQVRRPAGQPGSRPRRPRAGGGPA